MNATAPVVERLFQAMLGSRGFASSESTVTTLMDSISNGAQASEQVTEHILDDFSLTQKVLKLANSPMYAPFADETASVSSAIKVLGADALMHVVLSTPTLPDAQLQSDPALGDSKLSSQLARTVLGARGEDASIATLMVNLGQMVLEKYLPEEAALLQRKAAELGDDTQAAAVAVLGMTLQQLGTAVAQRWHLPRSVVSVIDGTGDADLIAIARFANAASGMVLQGKLAEVDQLLSDLQVPGIDKSGVSAIIRNNPHASAADKPPPSARASADAALEKLYRDLLADKAQSMDSLASAMFPTIVESLHAAHCLFFMRTKFGDWAIRYGFGKGLDELRGKLRLSKDYKPTAFHAAIMNNVDVSIADASRLKPTALPEGFRELLPKVNKFLILPLANSSVCGLLYCDWDSDNALHPAELEALKKLRSLFLPFCPP